MALLHHWHTRGFNSKKTNNYLSPSLTEHKNTRTYDIGNPGSGQGQAKNIRHTLSCYYHSISLDITSSQCISTDMIQQLLLHCILKTDRIKNILNCHLHTDSGQKYQDTSIITIYSSFKYTSVNKLFVRIFTFCYQINQNYCKKHLKIPISYSESVNRRRIEIQRSTEN